MPRRRGELWVFGIGPKGLMQLTLETLEAMKTRDEVYGTAFQEVLGPFCAKMGVAYRPLDWGGRRGQRHGRTRPGEASVEPIARWILARLGLGRRVGLVVEGHPSLFSFIRGLRARAQRDGHACRVFAAVHPLDQMLAALEPRMGHRLDSGLTLYSALAGMTLKTSFDPSLALFVYNIGHLHRVFPREFARLAGRLRRAWGPAHRAFLVECTPEEDSVRPCALAGLAGELRKVGVNSTLCIPARARGGPPRASGEGPGGARC